MPGKPKFGGGPPLPSIDAIVDAAMDIETAADVVAADADSGGLEDGERDEGERSGDEDEG
jgi:hypothetical protein